VILVAHVTRYGSRPLTLITLSAAELRVVMSESITSTGPPGPIAPQLDHAQRQPEFLAGGYAMIVQHEIPEPLLA
jgi:hypothetical protein